MDKSLGLVLIASLTCVIFISGCTTPYQPPGCTEDWSCSAWTPAECTQDGMQTRTCTDSSSCGTSLNKPPISQSCTPSQPPPQPNGTAFTPSVALYGIDSQTGKNVIIGCDYDESRNKVAIVIKQGGIYDDNEIINVFNRYFSAVKSHLNIDSAGVKKFSGSSKAELDSFIDNLVENDYAGYAILVGQDLPTMVPFDYYGNTAYLLDLDTISRNLTYVNRDPDGCVDVALSFVNPPDPINSSIFSSRGFITTVFENFINYHSNPTATYNMFNGRNFVIRHAEIFPDPYHADDMAQYILSPIFTAHNESVIIRQNLESKPLMLSYYVHGSPELVQFGIDGYSTISSTSVTTGDIIDFYNNNGKFVLFVDVLGACYAETLDYGLHEPRDQCCMAQTWLDVGAWSVSEVYNTGKNGFEKWLNDEKTVGKALRKTNFQQGFIHGDILAKLP